MIASSLVKQFNTDVLTILKASSYTTRYISINNCRSKWLKDNRYLKLLNSDINGLDGKSFNQLLAISYDLIVTRRVETRQLCQMGSGDELRKHIIECVRLFDACWNIRNDPKHLGTEISMMSFYGKSFINGSPGTIPYVRLAGAGEQFIPYLTQSLHYFRSSQFMCVSITRFLTNYIDSMLGDFYNASPDVAHLRKMYTKFQNETDCRRGVVTCLTRYPKEFTVVTTVMRQIARHDTNYDIRKLASDFVKQSSKR